MDANGTPHAFTHIHTHACKQGLSLLTLTHSLTGTDSVITRDVFLLYELIELMQIVLRHVVVPKHTHTDTHNCTLCTLCTRNSNASNGMKDYPLEKRNILRQKAQGGKLR